MRQPTVLIRRSPHPLDFVRTQCIIHIMSGQNNPTTDATARICDQIKKWISSGKLRSDNRLPPVRHLADQFHATRYAAHEACKHLRDEGWLRKDGRKFLVNQPEQRHAWHVNMSTRSILFLTNAADFGGHNALSPGYDLFIELGAMVTARQHHMNVVTFDPHRLKHPTGQDELHGLFHDRPQGAVVFHDTMFHELPVNTLRELQQQSIPIVVYGNGPDYTDCNRIESDHEVGGYALTQLLIKHGRRRILPFNSLQITVNDNPSWLESRMCGYRQAMKEANLKPLAPLHCSTMPCEMPTQADYDTAVKTAAGHLMPHINSKHPIDAIMAVSDRFTFPLATACRELFKLKPGRDILITGYDNYWADTLQLKWESAAPFATVDKRNMEIGRLMIEMLTGRSAEDTSGTSRHRLVRPDLVVIKRSRSNNSYTTECISTY